MAGINEADAGTGETGRRRTEVTAPIRRELILSRPLFTSADAARLTGAAPVALSKALYRLVDQGLLVKVRRGTWANPKHPLFSPYVLVGHLQETWKKPTYVSFTSALHLHAMMSQIPTEIHVATQRRREKLKTPFATYVFHHLPEPLLTGYEAGDRWGRFDVASPEKALFDSLWMNLQGRGTWRYLPEVELTEGWDWSRWDEWLPLVEFDADRMALLEFRQSHQANESDRTVHTAVLQSRGLTRSTASKGKPPGLVSR